MRQASKAYFCENVNFREPFIYNDPGMMGTQEKDF